MSWGMIVFLVCGFFLFICAIVVYSCEEGSCSSHALCMNVLWLFTCGGCLGVCDCRPKRTA